MLVREKKRVRLEEFKGSKPMTASVDIGFRFPFRALGPNFAAQLVKELRCNGWRGLSRGRKMEEPRCMATRSWGAKIADNCKINTRSEMAYYFYTHFIGAYGNRRPETKLLESRERLQCYLYRLHFFCSDEVVPCTVMLSTSTKEWNPARNVLNICIYLY